MADCGALCTIQLPRIPAEKLVMRCRSVWILAISFLPVAWAQRVGSPSDDLTNLSVDELFNVQVSSVGRKAQELSKAPAAVFVLTAEDIRRSGATCIPEALQWVPGLTVSRLDGRSWSVSARGGSRLYANQILVMIDGRSLYTPLFSGVIWDTIDVPLEDIEQIEVVRGAGAVMWGPNAVNGVINIITKSARATKGGSISASTGNELHGAAEAEWSDAPNDRLAFRTWGKLEDRQPAYGSAGYYNYVSSIYKDPSVTNLDEESGRLGFRMDAQVKEGDQLMVEGDIYKMGRQDQLDYPVLLPQLVDPTQAHSGSAGESLYSRWTHTAPSGGESALELSLDRSNVDYPFVGGTLSNLTLNFQNRHLTGENNEIYWGAGLQQYSDDTYSNRIFGMDPPDSIYRDGDVVIRDEWQIFPGRLMGSAGIRLDYNSHTHLEFQPSLRLMYTPSKRQSVWAAVSRAVREPNQGDRAEQFEEQELEGGFPVTVRGLGSPSLISEVDDSVEAGYRFQSGQRWSIDISGFRSNYSRLIAFTGSATPQVTFSDGVPALVETMTMTNAGAGCSHGGEVWATWQVAPGWKLMPSYSYLDDRRWLPTVPGRMFQWNYLPSDLRHQGWLRLQHNLSRAWQADLNVRARSRDLGLQLPGWMLVDAHLSYRPTHSGVLDLSVQNLAGHEVLEGYSELVFPSIPVRRTFVIKWTQRF
jgi:iron complex outermembrane recepter protein